MWDKNSFGCEFFVVERHLVAVIGKCAGSNDLVGFINVYGPNEYKERKVVWEMLELLGQK